MVKSSFDRDINKAIELAKRFGINKVILFGSCLTDPKHAMDIDIAVSGIPKDTLCSFVGKLIMELKNNIDVVDLDSVDNYLFKRIIEDGKLLYESKTQ